MDAKPTRSRLRRWLRSAPLLGVLAWGCGLVAIWYAVQSRDQSPGVLIMAITAWTLLFGLLARNTVGNLFGPVFVYEITRLGRRRSTFGLRILYVVVVLLILGTMYASWLDDLRYYGPDITIEPGQLARFANEFFTVFVVFQFCVAAFLTPAYVAGTIADEKERKTLEFLLATDLEPREIIFGKVAARVTNLVMYVLAGLPIIAFLQLFGGIHPDLVLASTAATIVTILGLAGVSIYFSTIMRKPRDAIVITYMVAFLYAISSLAAAAGVTAWQASVISGNTVPTFDISVTAINRIHAGVEWFAAGNPAWSLARMYMAVGPMGSPFTPARINTELMRFTLFWGGVVVLSIGTAIRRLRPVALRQGSGGNKMTRKALRRAKERPTIGDNPVAWKEVLVDGGGRGGAVVVFVVVLALILMLAAAIYVTFGRFWFAKSPTQGNFAPEGAWDDYLEVMNMWIRILTGGLATICMLSVAMRASTSISSERDKDTWVSLIATPLSSHEILFGKWLGAMLSARQLYFGLVLIWAYGMAVGAIEPIMIVPTILYLVIAVSAFAWMGLYWSVVSRNSLIAVIRAFMCAMFIGGGFWVVIGCCCAAPIGRAGGGDELVTVNVAQMLLAATPSFTVGWLPLYEFDERDLVPFSMDMSGGSSTIGPFAIPFAMIVWGGLNWLFYTMTDVNFAVASLRMNLSRNYADRQQKTPPGPSIHQKDALPGWGGDEP